MVSSRSPRRACGRAVRDVAIVTGPMDMRKSAGFERFSPVQRVIEVGSATLTVWRPPDMEALIDLAAFDADERIPYWADVWESAIVLAEELAAVARLGFRTVINNRPDGESFDQPPSAVMAEAPRPWLKG